MPIWKTFILYLFSLFAAGKNKCQHLRVNPLYIHDNHCPDCGKRVVAEWYFLKCSDCNTKRPGYHLFEEFIPRDKFCKRCGSKHFKVEIKQDLNFFELPFASFKLNEAEDFIPVKRSKTKVWLDPVTVRNSFDNRLSNTLLLPATVST